MSDFIDKKKIQCLPCDVSFGNISKLRSHMSLHFNWMKYICDVCRYKSYEKIAIIDHINKVHKVECPSEIESYISEFSQQETINMASKKFIPIESDDENDVICIDPNKNLDCDAHIANENVMEIDQSCVKIEKDDMTAGDISKEERNDIEKEEKSSKEVDIKSDEDMIEPKVLKGRGRPKKKKLSDTKPKDDEGKNFKYTNNVLLTLCTGEVTLIYHDLIPQLE